MKIAVVTDSTSDISTEEAQENHITVVPAVVVMDGKEYLDGETLSREEYYTKLPQYKVPPTTAAPSTGMITKAYKSLFEDGIDHIFSIHVASTLSGIYSAAKVAAENFGDRVTVVDSGQLSLGLGFQVLEAAKTAVGGSIQQVGQTIESIQERVRTMAMIDTLDQLKRSGRVSWLRTSLGSLLRIKLFVEVSHGEVFQIGEARTRNKAMARLGELLSALGPLDQLAVMHSNALTDAVNMAQEFASQVSSTPLVRNVTTVIGTHVGVNAVGFIAVKAE